MTFFRSMRACAVAASAGLALAACAIEPQYPIRREVAGPPPAPAPASAPPEYRPPAPPPRPRDPDAPAPAPTTPVQSTTLAPIGQAAPSPPPPPPPPSSARAAPAPEASPWARPPAAADTPGQVTVGRGETLFDVAERVRTPVRALIEVNNLQPPYAIAPGTVLRVPPPLFYTVTGGDTLFGIARRFSIDARSLANLNGLQLESAIRSGEKIALPSLARDQGANPQANGASPPGSAVQVASARPSAPSRASSSASAASSPPPAAEPSASDTQVAAVGRGKFHWPLKGAVLSGFGPKGPGQRNDGVNIAADTGDSVRAAAAGEVVFAGELPSFGNLVLIKHPDGWVTAYAHLSKIDVKMRDSVSQGQEVGLAGQTGMVDRPQLHFEIRYAQTPREKARPVDPALLLPQNG